MGKRLSVSEIVQNYIRDYIVNKKLAPIVVLYGKIYRVTLPPLAVGPGSCLVKCLDTDLR